MKEEFESEIGLKRQPFKLWERIFWGVVLIGIIVGFVAYFVGLFTIGLCM